jgi:hypothetical protein
MKCDRNRLFASQVKFECGKKTGQDKLQTTCSLFGGIIIPFFRGPSDITEDKEGIYGKI